MADIYIRNQIKNMTGRKLCSNDISPELIEIKRAALKLKRELKNKIKNDKA